MIVMDFVQGKTAQELWPELSDRLPCTIREQVERAVKVLHDIGLVFADLRKPNIMIATNVSPHEVKLVDCDWCGKHEEEVPCFSE
jgi:tRNA A-37 threonylcarbamoyl transferase component Bud32